MNKAYVVIALAALVAGAFPFLFPFESAIRAAALIFIISIAVLGLGLFVGLAQEMSLGHAGFFGLGAYAVAIGPARGTPALVSFGLSVVVAALVALIIGRTLLRLRGPWLALVTLGMSFVLASVATNEIRFTGGAAGMAVAPLAVFGLSVKGAYAWYWISSVTLIVAMLFAANLLSSPSGRALRMLRENEMAAQVLAADGERAKLAVFVLSAIYAAIAGAYLAWFEGHVAPSSAGVAQSMEFLAMALLGGAGSILGPVAGAAALIVAKQLLPVLNDFNEVVIALVLIVCITVFRPGIVPGLRHLLSRTGS
jgi:branched-chain amino acid transport system permease protein